MYTHQHLLKMVIIISSSMMLVFTAIRLVFFFARPDHIEFFHLCVRFFSSPGESSKPKAENKTLGVRANKTNPHWMEWERENK